MDRIAFKDMLAGSFGGIDNGSGRAHITDMRGVLVELGFDEQSVGALTNLARDGGVEDGTVDLGFVAEYAFETLAQVEQLEALLTY
jgi:hypothetical protein